jgi:GNAT superfamily N-acetyltransferase
LWAIEPEAGLPPRCPARVAVTFREMGVRDVPDLAVAMNLPSPGVIEERLANGRRCFGLWAEGRIACYGWVTHGAESVGELERRFNLEDDEAYIWDCGTLPDWQEQRCYSALLSHLIYRLHEEGVRRIWIGAGRPNKPSIQGFANAGFRPVMECDYRRWYGLTMMWFRPMVGASPELVAAGYRILVNEHEWRVGRVAVGYLGGA